jgi:hypothetical protein
VLRRTVASHRCPTVGHHRRVRRPSELSSLTASLQELTDRITATAERARDAGDEELAQELFAVERGLTGALRRLRRAETGPR